MASVYAGFGCKVTVIEALDRLLPPMDREFGQSLQMLLKKRGVDVFCSARVEKIEQTPSGPCCYFTHKDTRKTAEAQGVLVAIGRRPNTEGLFPPGTEPDMERGFIQVNERYESSIPGVYAVGDVIGGIQLAHKAEAEGMAAVAYMCGKAPETDPRLVPSTETDKLLGVQMMCGRATDLVSEFTGAILNGATHKQLLRGMRPHPSFCEGISEALEAVDGMSIHSAPAKRALPQLQSTL